MSKATEGCVIWRRLVPKDPDDPVSLCFCVSLRLSASLRLCSVQYHVVLLMESAHRVHDHFPENIF